MTIDVGFIYYRNFRFDGKFHVRCIGNDLAKIKSIHYRLEKAGSDGPELLARVTARSQGETGALRDHGCPATLAAEPSAGLYTIHPRVTLVDEEVIKLDLPGDADANIAMPPLSIEVHADEPYRSILDKVTFAGASVRSRRDVGHAPGETERAPVPTLVDPYGDVEGGFPYVEDNQRYPTLIIKFRVGGFEDFTQALQPASGSLLVRRWPVLKDVIDVQPLLTREEQQDDALMVLGNYYYLAQPDSMLNDTFVSLIRDLAALEYIEALQFVAPPTPQPFLLLAGSAVIATLLTGTAVVLGNKANENAKPTPDFEDLQTYLDAPSNRWQGMNIRKAWANQAKGKGARVHFSDGGLYASHEDLQGNPNLKIVNFKPNDDPEHGTASLGILLASANGIGMTGICHEAEVYLYDNRALDDLGRSLTLKQLLRNVQAGDIVAVNRQTANINVLSTFLPSLHDRDWWDVSRALTERGAIVVNAASNGSTRTDSEKGTTLGYGVDLSQWPFFHDHGEADAILVGACQSWDGKPHQYSNHSYQHRMLNAWGDSVATLGYGKLQDKSGEDRDYTNTYSGTSSATPLVTGALSVIQGYAIQQHHLYLNANQMHLLVMQSGYADATLPLTDVLPMGRRPNVHAALVLLDSILGAGRFLAQKDEL